MSIKDLKKFRSEKDQDPRDKKQLFCPTCKTKQYVVVRGTSYALAELCPDCMSPCPACENRGFTLRDLEFGGSVAEACKVCGPVRKTYARFNRARVPLRFANATLDSFDETGRNGEKLPNPALFRFMQLRKSLNVGDRGIGLSGKVGLGKTHLLCGLVRELALERAVAEQVECRFVEFTHLLADIRAGYDDGQGEAKIIGELESVPILVIDELGKGLTTNWQINILDELISRRYNRDVTTFFSTNYPFLENELTGHSRDLTDDFKRVTLEEKIGARMYSRLSEMCEFVTIRGFDHRRTQS